MSIYLGTSGAATLLNGRYGLDTSLLGIWQQIIIPASEFSNLNVITYDNFKLQNAKANSTFYIDEVYIVEGFVGGGGGSGDMLASVYDPNTVNGDVFLMTNMNGGNWKVFYTNGSGDVTELALGASGEVLTSNGASSAPTFQAPAGGGDALTTNPLSQFAATTSAQLAGVISDETGSGLLVFATSPTLTTPILGTPTSGTLTNCTGYVGDSSLVTVGTVTSGNVDAVVSAASDTTAGKVELATTAETETGTDATRAVTPDGLHDMTTLAGAAWFLDEDTMSSDSATKVASQQSIKAYVDTSLSNQAEVIGLACSDETTDLAVATGVLEFQMPFAMTLTEVVATVTTAPTGSTIIVDINEGGTSIMTTNKLSIDATEKTSRTAATAPGITDSSLANSAVITIDIDQIGSTVAGTGLKVWLIGTRT